MSAGFEESVLDQSAQGIRDVGGVVGAQFRQTGADRITIEVLGKEGLSLAKIAERIGKDRSSVSREVRRNRSQTVYRHGKAEKKARFRELEEALGLKVYFAKPYHSWERGTNENRNGIVRKVKPKGSALNDLTDEERSRIDYLLNDRPMRCLGWRTPREAFLRLLTRSPPRPAA